jgi:hypothetical protein
MKVFRTLLAGSVIALSLPSVGFAGESEYENWEYLFDGKSLAGWVQRGGKAVYRVEDGSIAGNTVPNTPNSFLCTERAFGDFLLEIDFKVDPNLNSGVQIRSNSIPEYKNGQVHGYQVEIDPSSRAWTGGIYDEGRRGWLQNLEGKEPARKAFKQGEWNHFRIEAGGGNIRTWLNGVPAADLLDSMTPRGFIALQVHATKSEKPIEVRWRNIRILDLEKKGNDLYAGDWEGTQGDDTRPIVAQVIALGEKNYRANLLNKFDTESAPLDVMEGKSMDGKVTFSGMEFSGEIKGGCFAGAKKGDVSQTFEMRRIIRRSPSLKAEPLERAEDSGE